MLSAAATTTLFLLSVLVTAQGAPTDELPVHHTNSSVGTIYPGIPSGTWRGDVGIRPVQQVGSQYQCLNCGTVYAPTTFTWSGTSLTVAISAWHNNQGCPLDSQTYHITGIRDDGDYYYVGSLTGSGAPRPVCFYARFGVTFVMKDDRSGDCPSTSASPSCRITTSGDVDRTWTGSTRISDCKCSLYCDNEGSPYASYNLDMSCSDCTAAECSADDSYYCLGGCSTCTVKTSCPVAEALAAGIIAVIVICCIIFCIAAAFGAFRVVRRRRYIIIHN
eukprot:m.8707 g.8707  ORF g.8707 m.8707 type:complete len:276 (-) comp7048_c0_seq1:263-1090(-)